MKLIITFLLTLIVSGGAFAQDGKSINSYKFYDTKKVEDYQKVKRRHLTIDVDSTGIGLWAWGGETWMIIGLRKKTDSMSYWRVETRNNAPSLEYGDKDIRFKTYLRPDGNFEFDVVFTTKPKNGKYRYSFPFQSQGLSFYYQPELTQKEVDRGDHRPDSVVGSYAVYHSAKQNNMRIVTGADTTYENYGTGKAFHIYRPKVWDAIGNTTWGVLWIDTIKDSLVVWVDGVWGDNAVLPVTIDPTFGYTTQGGTAYTIYTGNMEASYWLDDTPGAATIDKVTFYGYRLGGVADSQRVTFYVYDKEVALADCDLLTTSADYSLTTTLGWYDVAMSGTLLASTKYIIALMGYDASAEGRTRVYGDAGTYEDSKTNTGFTYNTAPATLSGFSDGSGRRSMYVTYTVSGGAAEPSQVIMINTN